MKQTKEFLKFVFSLTEGVFSALEDGKIGLSDLMFFVGAFKELSGAFEDINLVVKEIGELDEAKKNELKAWAAAEFDIANDGLEVAIESGLNICLELVALWNKIRVKK